MIGALAAWPKSSMIVSGGNDAAVRFWDLNNESLIGTLIAQTRNDQPNDWLAFTPEGLFDGSLKGEAMVKWRVGSKIVTLEQSKDRHYFYDLVEAIGKAKKPSAPEIKYDSPELKINTPSTDGPIVARNVELSIWSGETNPSELRLYQNGVPIKAKTDFDPEIKGGQSFYKTKVVLRKGENKFYAMASKEGVLDGKTGELTLRYDGPEPPGKVHTLAIGVSNYPKRPLKYAHEDARRIGKFLHSQGVNGSAQLDQPILLLNEKATPANIDNAFRTLAREVKGKPEDTVVLFLAGHTDTDTKNQQFCMLLPDFQFDGAAPLPPENIGLAIRGNVNVGSFRTKVGEKGVLPYSLLYKRLVGLDALQRMIIVDACQAGAILDDPAVRTIQKVVESETRTVRNSYILAARRGEPANEADALKQGLLTYTLLYGLKAPGLQPIDPKLGGFPGKPSADLNRDGFVTTDELTAYTDDALPKLSQMFTGLVMRAGGNNLVQPRAAGELNPGSPDDEKKVKLQTSETSFPLITIP